MTAQHTSPTGSHLAGTTAGMDVVAQALRPPIQGRPELEVSLATTTPTAMDAMPDRVAGRDS